MLYQVYLTMILVNMPIKYTDLTGYTHSVFQKFCNGQIYTYIFIFYQTTNKLPHKGQIRRSLSQESGKENALSFFANFTRKTFHIM